MPDLPHSVSGTAYKGPYEGYGLISFVASSGGGQTQNISVSDGVEVAASQTITLTHVTSEETLTAVTNASGVYQLNLGDFTSWEEGDALTLQMDTRSTTADDPNDCSKIMLRDERGKVHDEDYPILIVQGVELNGHPDIRGNVAVSRNVTRSDRQPNYEEVTFPDGTVYRRTFSYNSTGVQISRTRWVKQ